MLKKGNRVTFGCLLFTALIGLGSILYLLVLMTSLVKRQWNGIHNNIPN